MFCELSIENEIFRLEEDVNNYLKNNKTNYGELIRSVRALEKKKKLMSSQEQDTVNYYCGVLHEIVYSGHGREKSHIERAINYYDCVSKDSKFYRKARSRARKLRSLEASEQLNLAFKFSKAGKKKAVIVLCKQILEDEHAIDEVKDNAKQLLHSISA